LLPASWLYGMAVWVRNRLFDCGMLKSRQFDIPVICIGNLAVGGTGKTPHVEHLLRLLQERYRVAVLSRGYKRRTTGFVLANAHSTALDLGDEPMQLHSKFADVTVAVDENRCEGVEHLKNLGMEVVVLDDAFQHRHIHPSLSILLIEHDRLSGDRLLPAGRLREPMDGIRRADIVVVTKCPSGMSEAEYAAAARNLPLSTKQQLYFSQMEYLGLEPVFPEIASTITTIHPDTSVLLVSGIANPLPIEAEVRRHSPHVTHLAWGDHHAFQTQDIKDINNTFASLPTPRILVTTEKDAARLKTTPGLSSEVMHHAFQLPIRVKWLQGETNKFNQHIFHHISSFVGTNMDETEQSHSKHT
jgi:tetraacyldisaccharide 4'-kinase